MSSEPTAADPGPTPAEVPMTTLFSPITIKALVDVIDTRDEGTGFDRIGRVEGLVKGLKTDPINGISSDTIADRKKQWGENVLPGEDPITYWDLVKEAFSDHTILLLAFAAVVSIIIGTTTSDPETGDYEPEHGWIEGFAICVSICIVVLATTINDYNKEQKFRQLTDDGAKVDICVKRDGEQKSIDVSELVVGDVCMLNAGLVLPTDGIYLTGQSVVIDESSATGENDPKKKNDTNPFLLSSTTVNTAESAWMIVVGVGTNSFGGRLLGAAEAVGRRPTPLQEKLNDMAEDIGKIGFSVALLLFCCLSIIEIVQFAQDDDDAHGQDFLNYFIIAVSVVVVAVPEGLPLSVTIALAYSQNQMMEDNNQVRRLAACETMGNTTQICSDKTGTLTQNMMSVKQGYVSGSHFALSDAGAVLVPTKIDHVPQSVLDLLCEGITLNSSSKKEKKANTWTWRTDMGNKTENGMLDFVDRVVLNSIPETTTALPHDQIRDRTKPNDRFVFPFTSEKKRMSTFIRDPATRLWSTLHVKGASEKVLELSKHYYTHDGSVAPITDEVRAEIEDRILEFARDANRTIGVAVAHGLSVAGDEPEEPDAELVWIGVLGIQDPLRPEVKGAVKKCQNAGVTVRMCTGDNIDTAIAISKECGIYDESKHIAMTGATFREIVFRKDTSPYKERRELDETLEKMTVLARSQPLDKQLLVLMLMMRGEVVAVTGDGTNDAPALKLANVGFVMKSGTDIAVKSADIVLLDDNFRSVERAVVWGRTVNDNIRKFLQFQLCVNVVCVALTFVGSLSAEGKFPLKSVQLLWVNLIMDTFAALSLSTELPTEACLNRGPIPRKAPVVSRRMWRFILVGALYQLVVTILILHFGHDWFWVSSEWIQKDGDDFLTEKHKFNTEHMTIVFNAFVMMVIFNEFNARLLYDEVNIFNGFSRSIWFVVIIIIMAGFQVFAVEVTGDFMKTDPLSWRQWLVCIAFGFGAWIVGFLLRFLPTPEPTYDKVFDEEELDAEARKFYDKLQLQIAEAQAERQRAVQDRWGVLRAHARKVGKPAGIVQVLRRAALDRDVKTSSAYRTYQHFKDTNPDVHS
eukprot:PhM_4_TR5422/c1_g1_i1/m.84255/K05850/ATP2B; Ca2+ transporting ATPase, plasma membrane